MDRILPLELQSDRKPDAWIERIEERILLSGEFRAEYLESSEI
jgi:hypothetical protein